MARGNCSSCIKNKLLEEATKIVIKKFAKNGIFSSSMDINFDIAIEKEYKRLLKEHGIDENDNETVF